MNQKDEKSKKEMAQEISAEELETVTGGILLSSALLTSITRPVSYTFNPYTYTNVLSGG